MEWIIFFEKEKNSHFDEYFYPQTCCGFIFFFFLLKEKRNKKVQGRHESSAIRPSLASPSVTAYFVTFYLLA